MSEGINLGRTDHDEEEQLNPEQEMLLDKYTTEDWFDLPLEEQEKLIQFYSENTEFSDRLDAIDEAKEALQRLFEKDKTNMVTEETRPVDSNLRPSFFRLILLLIGILLALTVYFLLVREDHVSPIAEEFAKERLNLPGGAIRSGDGETSLAKEIKEAYISKNFQLALTLIDNIKDDSLKRDMLLYKGVIYYEKNDHYEAQKTLSELINNKYYYQYHACWYMSLSLLREGKTKEAKSYLEKVAGNPLGYQTEKANQLIKELY